MIRLVKAGISEDIIVQQIKKNRRPFDLSTDQLIQLKSASVSDRIIETMMDPSRVENGAPPANPISTPAGAVAPAGGADRSPPASESPMPTEVGVYANKSGQWAEVEPEIVYWRTSGVAKTVATLGVVKGNLNGHVAGAASPNAVTAPLEFVVVAMEGVAISEYQLVHLHISKGNREFRTVTGGVFHAQSGAAHDLVRFEGTKIAPHIFRVKFGSSLEPGEYGFLPPGSTGASGKLYSFCLAR